MSAPAACQAPQPTSWTPSRRPRAHVACRAQADQRPPAADAAADASGATSGWQATAGQLSRRAAGALLAATVTAAATMGGGLGLQPPPAEAVTQEQLLFLEAWRAVDRAYVDKKFNGQNWFKAREDALKKVPMGTREETYAAVRTLLASLGDPFTRFLSPEQYSALRRSTAGSVTGVGVEVSFSPQQGGTSALVVLSPAPGGPADTAGIRPGDTILAIDGTPTSTLSLYAAGNMLQGPEGSEVTLTVQPRGSSTSKQVKLARQPIAFNPVDSALCSSSGQLAPTAPDSKLGYIRVATFSKQTAEKVGEALKDLKAKGAERYVLDIRNNGGGLFPAGVEVGRQLLNRGDIVLIADSEGVRDIYSAENNAIDPDTPLVVLVNRGTASASEVLAGALKDNRRAAIAGENTFGKGLIQTLVELSDGSAVAVTVAKYQTPAGVDINKIGIKPTIPLTADQLTDIPLSAGGFCRFANTDPAPALF